MAEKKNPCQHPITSVTSTREVKGKNGVTIIVQYCTCVDCGVQCETNYI